MYIIIIMNSIIKIIVSRSSIIILIFRERKKNAGANSFSDFKYCIYELD